MNRIRLQRPESSAACALAVLVAVGVLLAGCGSSTATPDTSVTATGTNVAFTPCTDQTCSGQADGFPYKIEMPKRWNGTLLLYSHEFRSENMVPPATAPPTPDPLTGPTWTLGEASVSKNLLDAGFALAGASAINGGWAVGDQLKAADALYKHFSDTIAKPQRVYAWGPSTGAVTSVALAQTRDWVNGALGMCGLQAGVNPNYDIALDAAFAVKALLYPAMKLTDYSSYNDALKTYTTAMAKVKAAAADKYGPGALMLNIIGIVGAVPTKTSTLGGGGISGNAEAITANLEVILARGTIDRFGLEQQVGGNPSSNVGTDYYARVTPKQQESIDQRTPKATVKYMKTVSKAPRVAANPTAREQAGALPGVTGAIKVPTLTLHTEFDPLAIVQNEGSLIVAANAVGNDARRLLQVNVISPPMFYPGEGVAVPGAGHCSFTAASVAGSIVILNNWVQLGKFPTTANTTDLLGPDSGYNPDYLVRVWPAGPTE